jgi:hypothetical protein
MGYGQMAETYFQKRPDVLRVIEEFGVRRRLSLFKRLGQDQNDINFLSWLAEMKFGVQFDKVATTISYDRKIDGQTPDWFIEANKQEIIAEVARINLDETEMLGRVSEFVSPPAAAPGIVATSTSKSLHSQYFFGALGKIERKEEVYRELIKRRAIPFIICIVARHWIYSFSIMMSMISLLPTVSTGISLWPRTSERTLRESYSATHTTNILSSIIRGQLTSWRRRH